MLGQILAESLRAESLKWGFVRVHQLFAVLLVAAVLISFLIRAKAGPGGCCRFTCRGGFNRH